MDKIIPNLLQLTFNKDSDQKKDELRMLQEMFHGNEGLTTSILMTVLDENQGRINSAVDALLNLTSDPLNEKEPSPPSPSPSDPFLCKEKDNIGGKVLRSLQRQCPTKTVQRPEPEKNDPPPYTTAKYQPVVSSSGSPVAPDSAPPPAEEDEVISILQTQEIMKPFVAEPTLPAVVSEAKNVEQPKQPPARKLVCPTIARLGDMVGVSWDLGLVPEEYAQSPQPSKDGWIGLFKQNQPSNARYVTYQKTYESRGILDFAVPGLGTWEFRYFPDSSYECTMKSNLLVVGPQVELEATLDEERGVVNVCCRQLIGQTSSSDWIGLYNVETYHNKEYLGHQYVGDLSAPLSFPAPKLPGYYELRYFPAASSYNDVARSNLITIEDRDVIVAAPSRVVQGSNEPLTVTWQIYSTPPSKWDWVGLYPADSTSYIEYHYVNSSAEPICVFNVPKEAGQYQLRYYSSAASSFLPRSRRSTKITVLPPADGQSRATI
jgi:hypothetical protein